MRKICALAVAAALAFACAALAEPGSFPARIYAQAEGAAEAPAIAEGALYAQALAALEAGDLEEAQALFAGLHLYEDSRDYYIYTTARIYERDGAREKAVALYLIVPDTLDATDRLARLEASEEKPAGITIGGKLDKMPGPAATPAPPTPAPARLPAFHDFIDGMPYEVNDFSKRDNMYTLYYYIDDFAQLDAYRALFSEAGWREREEPADADGWRYVYIISPDRTASFYIAYFPEENLVVLMFDSEADYGFDPLEGL